MNLTLRTLTERHAKILAKIRAKYGRGYNSNAGAIAKAIEEWEQLQTRAEEAEARAEEAEQVIRTYEAASGSAARAMEEESRALAVLVKWARRKPEKVTQLRLDRVLAG